MRIFAALTSIEGIRGWWDPDARGDASEGHTFAFAGGRMDVVEADPSLVRWRYSGPAEDWVGTEVRIQLVWRDGQSFVLFTHADWREPTEFMRHCSTKWATYLLSLRDLVERGAGRPARWPNGVNRVAPKKLSAKAPPKRLESERQLLGASSVSEFLFLFRGSRLPLRSPDQMQRSFEKWRAWFSDLQQKGILKDPGHPLERSGKFVQGRAKDVHDGPYAEVKDLVNGYVLIEAPTIDEAVNLSKGCPIFEDDGSVEVRPIAKL